VNAVYESLPSAGPVHSSASQTAASHLPAQLPVLRQHHHHQHEMAEFIKPLSHKKKFPSGKNGKQIDIKK